MLISRIHMPYTVLFVGVATIAAIPFVGGVRDTGDTRVRRSAMPTLTVDLTSPGPKINSDMWGIFFEDINFAADGGLHAELIKNRSFEFDNPLMGWTLVQSDPGSDFKTALQIKTDSPLNISNTRYLRASLHHMAGLENEGFRGMGIKKGEAYNFRTFARATTKAHPKALIVELVNESGAVIASASAKGFSKDWSVVSCRLTAKETVSKAKLRVLFDGRGSLDLDMISLYPEKTWKNRPNGLRADLVQKLANLKPGFVRFPGGCIVEGRYLSTRYQWKKTIGPPEERENLINRWNNEFGHKPAPDYFQSFGLGFFEYFQMCEDIGAQPLPVVNCGMACQFNSKQLAPMSEIDTYVQDALDLIEFANGSAESEWGAKRAAMGHPAPFSMKYIGVGNEQWGMDYFPRYEAFAKAIKAKYPQVTIVTSAGPSPDNPDFTLAWKMLKGMPKKLVDIVDEHCYALPDWFFDNTHRYDKYDRSGPKVFMGEYAAQSVGIAKPENQNTWLCAISEAAFLTGLERNSDVVRMASYAPLYAHVDAWQWSPNMIWFDNLHSYATPNYYVQQLFMRNRGDRLVHSVLSELPVSDKPNRLYASTVLDEKNHELIVKVVNGTEQLTTMSLRGVNTFLSDKDSVSVTVLQSGNNSAVNSLADPTHISPTNTSETLNGSDPILTVTSSSVTVFRIRLRQ
ncbi:MAG: alpha-L-arabinofuranosidase C-terminal domain-containing protein [Chthonomonadales bacterium]